MAKAAQIKPVVKVGQVWQDNDSRHTSFIRLIEVKRVVGDIVECVSRAEGKERNVKINVMRFRPTASGYKLYKDV